MNDEERRARARGWAPIRVRSVKFPLDVQWLTTSPNPRVVCHTEDDGQRGWRVHALILSDKGVKSATRIASLCGLRPAHGWGMDLFVARPCERCVAKLRKLGGIVDLGFDVSDH